MNNLPRQKRAEELANRFRSESRRPIVIEFAGVPKAGKTSTIGQVHSFLKRCGFRVRVVIERASVCPIRDKKHSTFNVWTACTTLAQILEHTQDPPRPEDPDILILDRGLFDAICWFRIMDRLSRLRSEDRAAIESFILLPDWRKRINGVVVMTVSAEAAMQREQGHLPVSLPSNREGSIMNPKTLAQIHDTVAEVVAEFKDHFPVFQIDTTRDISSEAVSAAAADHVLHLVESHLQEDILSMESQHASPIFGAGDVLFGTAGNEIIGLFGKHGDYRPRSEVESRADRIQALPVVVVRNKTGRVLMLRRREREIANPLHDKVVIWAGGHVRKEDGLNGHAIVRAALRELAEELRLSVETDELRFLGAVHSRSSERMSKHVALVYEWRAPTDDVELALCAAEFFERRGGSLSGSFVDIAEIAKRSDLEPWSQVILEFLGTNPADRGHLF